MEKRKGLTAFLMTMLLLLVGLTPMQVSAAGSAGVSYRTHVQNDGWQGYVRNGGMSGTEGRSLRLEGINIRLENQDYSGGIEYRTHVQNIGWQSYVSNGAMSGTSGRSLRLEAIQIRLTGEMAQHYDVYYRVHAQNVGWMGWAKNNEPAGTAGYSYRLEGIQIRLIPKGESAPGSTANAYKHTNVEYRTHVENVGWQGNVSDGATSGTSGRSLRLEGICISLPNQEYSGSIEYRTHVQNIGWQNYVSNGAMSGTSGRSLRLEGIQIRLTEEMAQHYDVYYRVHAQNFGWMGWAKNDEPAGTEGYSYRLEGIQIRLVQKGGSAPGSTTNAFSENPKADKTYVIDLGNGRTTTVVGHYENEFGQQAFQMLNEYRVQNGLNQLSPSAVLDQGTAIRAYEIAESFSHTRPNGSQCSTAVPSDMPIGENIAKGYSSSEAVMKGWKNSPGHNANMLYEDYTYGSVCCFAVKRGSYYEYCWVQLFGIGNSNSGNGGNNGSNNEGSASGFVADPSDKTYVIELGNGQTTTVVGHYEEEYGQQVVDLLNAYRVQNGLKEFSTSEVLNTGASIRAREIAHTFGRTRPNGEFWTTAYGEWFSGGEFDKSPCSKKFPEDVLEELREENDGAILNKEYTKIGVSCFAVRRDGYYDEFYWVVSFGNE